MATPVANSRTGIAGDVTVPVSEPVLGVEEEGAVIDALRRGELSGTFGRAVREFEQVFADYVGVRHAVACSSGSAALLLAVAAAGIESGSHVLVSASTHVSTALAAFHNGLVTVPVDSEPETGNLDLDLLESLITPATRAIMPVHLWGHPVDMDRLGAIAARHGLVVIEDCAESHGATVRGRMTGSFGDMGCFSFYSNKVLTCGEGGMVTTDDDRLAARLRHLADPGLASPRFVHREPGFNFRLGALQAAIGGVQVQKAESIVERKREIAVAYSERLHGTPGLRLPLAHEWARHVYWAYAVIVDEGAAVTRDELMAGLRARGVETRTFFCPMSKQPVLLDERPARLGGPSLVDVPTPVADDMWVRGMYLPSSVGLNERTIDYVTDRVREILC